MASSKRSGFYQISNRIFEAGLNPKEFIVYSYFVSLAGAKDKCWPGMKTIARNCCMCENTARAAVRALVKKGYINRVETYRKQWNGKPAQSNNEYYLLTPPWEDEPEQ